MPMFFCPHCNARIMVGFDCKDFVHDCTENIEASNATKQEDVVVTGDWEDYSGSGTKGAYEVLMQGAANELQGTRASIEGKDKNAETRRGATAATHRQRNHLEFINIKKEVLN